MKKEEVKHILMSLRTSDNESIVNNLLGKIDMMDEQTFQSTLEKIGANEDDIRNFFENKLSEKKHNANDEKFPINSMFTYGLSGNCIHLHLPVDLHEIFSQKGLSSTLDIVNLYLLDAIGKIKELKNNGFYKFQDKEIIYMISPALIMKEIKFLDEMSFNTMLYRKKDLNDDTFVSEHPEARLATHIFGKTQNVGTASISFDTISSKEWEDKKNKKINEFSQKNITLPDDPQIL